VVVVVGCIVVEVVDDERGTVDVEVDVLDVVGIDVLLDVVD